MEFVKVGKNYLIKNSNGKIVTEKEKLQLENNELVLEDINSNGCVKEITKKISKNKKRIKELETAEDFMEIGKIMTEGLKAGLEEQKTALEEKVQNDSNEETSTSV